MYAAVQNRYLLTRLIRPPLRGGKNNLIELLYIQADTTPYVGRAHKFGQYVPVQFWRFPHQKIQVRTGRTYGLDLRTVPMLARIEATRYMYFGSVRSRRRSSGLLPHFASAAKRLQALRSYANGAALLAPKISTVGARQG
jgi:hypothetical protein